MRVAQQDHEGDLAAAVESFVTSSKALLVTDFDGTISRFTVDPTVSVVDAAAGAALRKLSELPNTFVAVLSGRALGDLRPKLAHISKLRVIGSHGHEFDVDTVAPLAEADIEMLDRASSCMREVAARHRGSRVERKPHGAVFHYRGADAIGPAVLGELRDALRSLSAGMIRTGDKIVEFSIVATHKGDAIRRLQGQVGPAATLFIGDDLTDEAGFEFLGRSGITIKIGSGPTAASFSLPDIDSAIDLLARVAERRAAWIRSSPSVEIDHHAFLSDLRTAALVDETGAITWLCIPKIDGPPLFSSLVCGPGGGRFRISSARASIGFQGYDEPGLIATTDFGDLKVIDFLDCSGGRSYQRGGRSDLVRIIEGSGVVEAEFAPKFDFGRIPTRLVKVDGGLRVECAQQRLVLMSPGFEWEVSREGDHDAARAKRVMKRERLAMTLLIGTSTAQALRTPEEMRKATSMFWNGWTETLKLPSLYQEAVLRSAVVLRGLTYGPNGAIAAAASTSLPEVIGGVRNWDYRYCWIRDASFAASSLLRLDASGPAMRLLEWLLQVVEDAGPDEFLAPLYSLRGGAVISEADIGDAFGYRGSRPVRIGNLAGAQLQLDTLAPVAEMMSRLARGNFFLTEDHLDLGRRLVELVRARWRDPDSGIWEVRGVQRHYVHSKLMCWYTVKCCIDVAAHIGAYKGEWDELLALIRNDIETKGFSEALGSYKAAYDLESGDAALLWVVLSGFHPPEHPRARGTLEYIRRSLLRGGLVHRYDFDDSLPGAEGEFILCRCWLVEALAMVGEVRDAQFLMEGLFERMNSLLLLSEGWDGGNQCAVGNYPQAYSHLGVINAACALSESLRG